MQDDSPTWTTFYSAAVCCRSTEQSNAWRGRGVAHAPYPSPWGPFLALPVNSSFLLMIKWLGPYHPQGDQDWSPGFTWGLAFTCPGLGCCEHLWSKPVDVSLSLPLCLSDIKYESKIKETDPSLKNMRMFEGDAKMKKKEKSTIPSRAKQVP